MGVKYRDVVVKCLTGDFGLTAEEESGKGGMLQGRFWSEVVSVLDQLVA